MGEASRGLAYDVCLHRLVRETLYPFGTLCVGQLCRAWRDLIRRRGITIQRNEQLPDRRHRISGKILVNHLNRCDAFAREPVAPLGFMRRRLGDGGGDRGAVVLRFAIGAALLARAAVGVAMPKARLFGLAARDGLRELVLALDMKIDRRSKRGGNQLPFLPLFRIVSRFRLT